MGQLLYCSAADAGVWGERGYGDGSNPYAWLSSITLLLCVPDFPPQTFPTTISSLTSLGSVSLQSTAALALGLLHNPSISAPSHCTFQETCVPVRVMYGCGKDCLILIPFRLPLISCFTLSLKCFFSDSDWTPASVPSPAEDRSNPTNTSFFPLLVPSSYRVLHGRIHSFPLVKYSCSISDGALQALLCLKIYSSCNHGEKYTPHPHTPPPSCSPSRVNS